ncbi:MAG: hypothetical protein ACI9FB_002248 [Candidatus Azotimanducaceae bacterium]
MLATDHKLIKLINLIVSINNIDCYDKQRIRINLCLDPQTVINKEA